MSSTISAVRWVAMARSLDEGRPVLTGVNARDGWIEATDGHRLHVAPNETKLPGGIWAVGTPELIAGTYPETGKVLPVEEPVWNYMVADPVLALALARAGDAANLGGRGAALIFFVSFPSPDGATVYVNPRYVREVLSGMQGPVEVLLHIAGRFQPLTFFARKLKRAAVVMPSRLSDPGPREGCALPLTPFLTPIAGTPPPKEA